MLIDMDAGSYGPEGLKFEKVDQQEFDRLKRLPIRDLTDYMAARDIDGVLLSDDPTMRIVA